MSMREISRYFDRTQVFDIDTGALLFRGQFNNYDGSKRDAFAAYRRILSLDPDIVIPVSRCVSAMGKNWMLGDDQVDGWEELHRRKFVAHEAQGKAYISTLAGHLAGSAPAVTWGDMRWMGGTAEESESSDHPSAYVAILPTDTAVRPYDIVTVQGVSMLVQTAALLASGFMEARGLMQEGGLGGQALQVSTRTFDPVTGGYTEALGAPITTLRVRWQELFAYGDQMDKRFQEGDTVFAVAPATPVKLDDALVHGDARFTVKAIKPMAGVKALHARPVL